MEPHLVLCVPNWAPDMFFFYLIDLTAVDLNYSILHSLCKSFIGLNLTCKHQTMTVKHLDRGLDVKKSKCNNKK